MLHRVFLILILCLNSFVAKAFVSDIRIAAGSMSGVYYPAALQLCNFISKYSPSTQCNVLSTGGSLNNVSLLLTGKVDFALVQSDIASDAYRARGIFNNQRPFKSMRLVAKLFPEIFTVIARDDSAIVNFSDLDGKKIGINLRGSGSKNGFLRVLRYFDFTSEPEVLQVIENQMPNKLCDGDVDAVVLFSGHPSSEVRDITDKCDAEFVSVDSFKLDSIMADNPIYNFETIMAHAYKRTTRSVNSFSTLALLVVSTEVEREKVELITQVISKNFDEFTKLYPVFNNLTKKKVFGKGVVPFYED